MKRHTLKIYPHFFEAQIAGDKPFEVRKDDRAFAVGDELELVEVVFMVVGEVRPTGRSCVVSVTYKLDVFEGLKPGYCILGTRLHSIG